MKTSFYFVLWILIYPILEFIDINFINNNSFLVALVTILGTSWLIKRTIPNVITYNRASEIAPILEDVYTENIAAFKKRLSRQTIIEVVTSIYFIVTIAVIIFAMIKTSNSDWFALIVFGFFAFSAISRSFTLMKALNNLKNDFTSEICMNIAKDTYKLDYSSYYEARQTSTYSEMLPSRPRFYKVFQIASLVIAIICTVLGLLYLREVLFGFICAILDDPKPGFVTLLGMYSLYGSLASYFGIKDIMSCIQHFRSK